MAEPDHLTVGLSRDDWRWVMSLVVNSAYIRAKPIVEAVEAAVKTADWEATAAMERRSAVESELKTAQRKLRESELRTTHLERQVDGYKGQLVKRKNRGTNGEDHSAEVKSLQELLKAASEARKLLELRLREAQRDVGLLHERIRTGVWPANIPLPEPAVPPEDVEAELNG